MPRVCEFIGCDKDGRIHYDLPNGKPCWFCAEHYDEMFGFYCENAASGKDKWAEEVVAANGW